MADVTGGTPPTNASSFDVAADVKEVYDHFGDPGKYTVATLAALPSSGNWVGRRLWVQDVKELRVCTALPGTWVDITKATDTGWFQAVTGGTDITLGSGWSHHSGSGWTGLQFRVRSGRVDIQGALAKSSWGTPETIATLAVPYRPAVQIQGTGVVINTTGGIVIGFAGTVAASFQASYLLGA